MYLSSLAQKDCFRNQKILNTKFYNFCKSKKKYFDKSKKEEKYYIVKQI